MQHTIPFFFFLPPRFSRFSQPARSNLTADDMKCPAASVLVRSALIRAGSSMGKNALMMKFCAMHRCGPSRRGLFDKTAVRLLRATDVRFIGWSCRRVSCLSPLIPAAAQTFEYSNCSNQTTLGGSVIRPCPPSGKKHVNGGPGQHRGFRVTASSLFMRTYGRLMPPLV